MGKVLTKEPTCIEHANSQFEAKDDVWCYCKKGEEGNKGCDNDYTMVSSTMLEIDS